MASAPRKSADGWYDATPDAHAPCCAHDPNDSCDATSAAAWLRFADWYQWPHISYFDNPSELHAIAAALRANGTRRREISERMRAFFASERARARGWLVRALFAPPAQGAESRRAARAHTWPDAATVRSQI